MLSVQDYGFNYGMGNLMSRKDAMRNLTETFGYNQNRLVTYKDANMTYNSQGNILSKSDAGILTQNEYQTATITPLGSVATAQARKQEVTYTSSMRPATITENGYQATFSYNADNQRVKMQVKKNGAAYLTRHYLGNQYEIDDQTVGGTKEKLYLGGGYYGAYAVYVKQNGVWKMNYICRDYLGSITHIIDSAEKVVAEYSYDAWGRLRNPATQAVYAPGSEPELLLGRGYTGHEHLSVFGLINMNARLYDPVLGVFLSPDPYVQAPDNTMNYNRYAYAMNNPMKYTDPSGEFLIFDSWLSGLFAGGWKEARRRAKHDIEIWGGLFTTDSNKNFWGQTWEFISRFTWQLPQTVVGFAYAQGANFV
jgi:RHS repeat-associated protein